MLARETTPIDLFLPLVENCYYSPLLNLFRREAFPPMRGGFLCSQFGLGKTVMVLSLLLARRVPRTLVVTSTSLLAQWETEIATKTDLRCSVVHGPRADTAGEVVLTTYGKVRRNDELFVGCAFDRIVLDESHTIKNSNTRTCQTLATLTAPCRWCVTATPAAQLSHLYGQLQFFGPWTTSMFTQLLRARLPTFQQGNRLAYFAGDAFRGHDRTQRYRGTDVPIVALSDCRFTAVRVALPAAQRSQYRRLSTLPVGLGMGQVLSFVEKVRSWCSGGEFFGGGQPSLRRHVVPSVGDFLGENNCAICLCFPTDPVLTPCQHVFCEECVAQLFATRRNSSCASCPCPLCRAAFAHSSVKYVVGSSAAPSDDTAKKAETDVKINAAFETMYQIFDANPAAKIVVFSQFIPCLEKLVQRSSLLLPQHVECSYIHGSTQQRKRAQELEKFARAESGAVIFLSVRSAACGLNLQMASDAIMVEPLLNKGLEQQAFGRINRIGRVETPPTVHRVYFADTIEERILELDDDAVLTRSTLVNLLS